MNSNIWLGDLARALQAVEPTPDRRELVADLLGLGPGTPRPTPAGAAASPGPTPGLGSSSGPEPAAQPSSKVGREPEAGSAPEPAPGPSSRVDLEPGPAPGPGAGEPTPPVPPPVLLNEELPLLVPLDGDPIPRRWVWRGPTLAELRPGQLAPRIPFSPLLAPYSAEVVLRSVASRWVRDGPVDTDGLVQILARGQPVRALPRRPVATLRFGTQVLVDLGRGMEPFIDDQGAVLDQLAAITGRNGLSVRYFQYRPLSGVSETGHSGPSPYLPPPPGTRVLVLSDLGLGGSADDVRRATRAEWESFGHLLSRHGCQAAALVPLPPRRWPGWLVRLFPLVSWDRRTTAGEAARRMGRR